MSETEESGPTLNVEPFSVILKENEQLWEQYRGAMRENATLKAGLDVALEQIGTLRAAIDEVSQQINEGELDGRDGGEESAAGSSGGSGRAEGSGLQRSGPEREHRASLGQRNGRGVPDGRDSGGVGGSRPGANGGS